MMNDVKNGEEATNGLQKAMKSWMVNVDLIRSYYGDQVAVYFEFMNYFLKWIFVPGIAGTVVSLINRFVYNHDV